MFLYRRPLLRLHPQKLLGSTQTTKFFLSLKHEGFTSLTEPAAPQIPGAASVHENRYPPLDPHSTTFGLDPLAHMSSAHLLRNFNQLLVPNCAEHIRKPAGAHTSEHAEQIVDLYLSLRIFNPQLLRDLPAESFARVARQAAKERLTSVVDKVAQDLIEVHNISGIDKTAAILAMLEFAGEDPSLRHDRVLALFALLACDVPFPPLSTPVLVRITSAILSQSTHEIVSCLPLLESLVPILIEAACEGTAVDGPGDVYECRDPPNDSPLWLAFRVLQTFLETGNNERALGVLEALLRAKKVPADAIRRSDQETGDFHLIVTAGLVRSCIHYGWLNAAAHILKAARGSSDASWARLSDLAADLVDTFLQSGMPADVENCGKLIRTLTVEGSNFMLPDFLILRFYTSAYTTKQLHLAVTVYLHFQSEAARGHHQYPPPKSRSLTWMMSHFLEGSRMDCARMLAKHVVATKVPMFPTVRAPFISMCAKAGFSTEATALWKRYSIGKNGIYIAGQAGVMLRMVGLLASQDRKQIDAAPWSSDDPRPQPPRKDGPARADTSALQPPCSNATDRPLPSARCFPVQGSAHPQDIDSEAMVFARHIVSEFENIKAPLAKASHMDINALARAHSILGNFAESLGVLKILLERFEIPDLHDINVIVAAMAKHHPRGAALMVERMIAKGVLPNRVTLSTVINGALDRRDHELVGRLVVMAEALGLDGVTDKAVVSVLRTVLSAGHGKCRPAEGETLKRYARGAYAFLQGHGWTEDIYTPNLGKKCIQASMRADAPELAFKFWQMLVKGKTEWNHRGQVESRRLIADKIRRQCREGKVGERRGRRMVVELEG